MFPMLDCSVVSLGSTLSELLAAAENKRYPTLYALLDKLNEPLSSEDGCCMLLQAGLSCSIRAFRAILDHCSPGTEQLYTDDYLSYGPFFSLDLPFPFYRLSLQDKAARDDRPEHLDELLRRGHSPNGYNGRGGSSVLLASFLGKSPRCVRRLVREPNLNLSLSPHLLSLWAKVGLKGEEKLEQCCRALAPRLQKEAASSEKFLLYHGTPIPPKLDLKAVLLQLNFPLAEFLCRNRELSVKEGMAAMEALGELVSRLDLQLEPHRFSWRSRARNISRQQLTSMLNALFTACPQLLHRRLPQTLLFFTALSGKLVPPLLRPWLEQVRGGKIALDTAPGLKNLAHALLMWEERFGSRWIPTLDPTTIPHSLFIFYEDAPIHPGLSLSPLEILLFRCQIRGFSPGKKLTFLSQVVLHVAPIPLLLRQLQPGGLLAKEDPKVLQDYCLSPEDGLTLEDFNPAPALEEPLSPQRRQAVLVHLKTEVNYEL